MHSSLIGKIQKAHRYVQEPDRINFQQFSASFRGEHDSYTVSYSNGNWHCSCNFFTGWGVCSHTMAIQKLLGVMLPSQTGSATEQAAEIAIQA